VGHREDHYDQAFGVWPIEDSPVADPKPIVVFSAPDLLDITFSGNGDETVKRIGNAALHVGRQPLKVALRPA
jgi:hypothetical protein